MEILYQSNFCLLVVISNLPKSSNQVKMVPPLPYIKGEKGRGGGGGVEFQKFSPKEGGSEFFHKKGGVCKIGGCFKIGDITNKHQLTLSKVIFLSVCGLFGFLIYTIYISVLCVSQEGLSLVESNQQIYDFYK